MKIALTLSGQIRSFERGYQYIYNSLLKNFDVDVYFHTWHTNWDSKILDLYKPVDYIIEYQDAFFDAVASFDRYRISDHNHPAKNTIMMYRSIKRADALRKEKSYDWIVRTRFDFALNQIIDFQSLDKQKLYFCNTRSNETKSVVHDQFCVATEKDMDIYSSVYDFIDEYHNNGCVVNGENLLEHHLVKNSILGSRVEYLDLNPPFDGGNFNAGRHSLIRDDMHMWVGVNKWD